MYESSYLSFPSAKSILLNSEDRSTVTKNCHNNNKRQKLAEQLAHQEEGDYIPFMLNAPSSLSSSLLNLPSYCSMNVERNDANTTTMAAWNGDSSSNNNNNSPATTSMFEPTPIDTQAYISLVDEVSMHQLSSSISVDVSDAVISIFGGGGTTAGANANYGRKRNAPSPATATHQHDVNNNDRDHTSQLCMDMSNVIGFATVAPSLQHDTSSTRAHTSTSSFLEVGHDISDDMPNFFDTGTDDEELAAASSTADDDIINVRRLGIWSQKLAELSEFKREHGHCLVPSGRTQYSSLFTWIKRQRYQYKLKYEGKKTTLRDDRERALNEVGLVWYPHDALWEQRFQDLVAFKAEFGHCNVPFSYVSNQKLATWIKSQRFRFATKTRQIGNAKQGMRQDRIDRLNELGFVWKRRGGPNVSSANNSISSGDGASR